MNKIIIIVALIAGIINPIFCERLGVGIIIGSPTGFTLKFILARNSALAGNVGWSIGDNPRLHLTGDYQFLFPTVLRWTDEMNGEQREIKNLTPFLGIGGRFKFKENEADQNTELNIGLRLGGGIEYGISRFGIFLELYPVVNILPATDFDIEGGLGGRFYF
ncbi:MAG: hypothetical protein ABIL39_10020 [candidate division WOR-3 bacterium]